MSALDSGPRVINKYPGKSLILGVAVGSVAGLLVCSDSHNPAFLFLAFCFICPLVVCWRSRRVGILTGVLPNLVMTLWLWACLTLVHTSGAGGPDGASVILMVCFVAGSLIGLAVSAAFYLARKGKRGASGGGGDA